MKRRDSMNTCWFLGANTADGFVSRFEQLHPGGRVKRCVILKGGPGCGKSTFLKRLRRTAEDLGADTESYPCSSDPGSLDGLFLPSTGMAFVDGTAPHAAATAGKNRRAMRLRPPQASGSPETAGIKNEKGNRPDFLSLYHRLNICGAANGPRAGGQAVSFSFFSPCRRRRAL